MARGRITAIRAIPGSTSLGPILSDFAKKKTGLVTAFSDSLLPMIRDVLGEQSNADALPFGEIVRNVLVLCGEEALPIAQSGQRHAAIAHACAELPNESPFAKVANFSGFHRAVALTLDELRHWGIDADEMMELAEACDPRLAAKLHALAEIDRSAVEILSSLGRQLHSEQLQACLDSTPELEDAFERLLVFAGSEEDPLRIEWLRWLASHGAQITLVFDRHATGAPIFAGVERSIAWLGVKAVDRGDGNMLTRNLFGEGRQGGPPISVSIVSAADPLAEVEWALRGAIRDGVAHRAAMYVRDLESYAPLIESAAKRFGIPIRMARRAPLLTNSFGRLTLSALRFCASRDVRTLAPILRSSYLHLTGEAQRSLDSRLRDCFVQRSEQWNALQTWAEENVDPYGWLVALLEWRRKAVSGGRRLAEWFVYLKEFNRDQRLPWVTLENKGGLLDERDRRALNQMERILANHISVADASGPEPVRFEDFVGLCERLWSDGDVSIPFAEEGLRVGSDPNVVGDADRLFVLGMLEGVFPRRRSEDPILTDQERTALSALRPNRPALPDSQTKAEAERDAFYRVCAAARREVVFSYPMADDEKDNIPAFYLEEVRRAAGVNEALNYPRPLLAPFKEQCQLGADVKLREAFDGPQDVPIPIEIVSPRVRDAIRPTEGAAFEPGMLRDALECPFRYLARHVLKLQTNRPQSRWYTLRRLPQVAQLLSLPDLAQAERALRIALESQLDQMFAEVPEWEMRLLRAGGERLIRDWIHREALSREKWAKNAGSVKVNVAFGTHGVRDQMMNVRLEGSIAAVSRLDRYTVAHLYRASVGDTSKLSPSERLYYGLYLLAMYDREGGTALEVESMSGKRTLMVLGRGNSRPLAASVNDGLYVVDLADNDDVAAARQAFYEQVKTSLREAVQRMRGGAVDAITGEQCDHCDFGELCRRARAFGEIASELGDEGTFEDE